MLREKAGEISAITEFRPTKSWVLAWKEKYNVSLENQTYGNAGETEGEIVEESQVYDEVTIQVCLCVRCVCVCTHVKLVCCFLHALGESLRTIVFLVHCRKRTLLLQLRKRLPQPLLRFPPSKIV